MRKIAHTGSTIGQKHPIALSPENNLGIEILVNRQNAAPWENIDSIAAMSSGYREFALLELRQGSPRGARLR